MKHVNEIYRSEVRITFFFLAAVKINKNPLIIYVGC